MISLCYEQGFIDTAAVDSFFADCVAQRLGHASTSGGVPSPNLVRRAATTSAVRDMDATGHGVYGRKPPIPPALYNGRNGPPAPLQSSFAAPQVRAPLTVILLDSSYMDLHQGSTRMDQATAQGILC